MFPTFTRRCFHNAQCSDPVRLCSTIVGRFLLGWYCSCEDYCCLRSAYGMLLPSEWRQENIRIRQKLAITEYPRLSPKDRKPRLLEDRVDRTMEFDATGS